MIAKQKNSCMGLWSVIWKSDWSAANWLLVFLSLGFKTKDSPGEIKPTGVKILKSDWSVVSVSNSYWPKIIKSHSLQVCSTIVVWENRWCLCFSMHFRYSGFQGYSKEVVFMSGDLTEKCRMTALARVESTKDNYCNLIGHCGWPDVPSYSSCVCGLNHSRSTNSLWVWFEYGV